MQRIFNLFVCVFAICVGFSTVATAQYFDSEPEPGFDYPPTYPVNPVIPPIPTFPPLPTIPPLTSSTGGTTLFVGTPGYQPGRVRGYGISTNQIDAALDPYSSITGLSTSYTTNVTESTFADLESLRQNAISDLITAIENSDAIHEVKALDISANPVKLRLQQSGTKVRAEVSGFEGFINLDIDLTNLESLGLGLITGCWDISVKVEVEDLKFMGQYDVYTGVVNDIGGDITLKDIDINCALGGVTTPYSLFGVPIAFFDAFFFDKPAFINNMMDDMDFSASTTFFSVRDFMDGLRGYGDLVEMSVASFPSSVTIDTSGLSGIVGNGVVPNSVTIDVPQTPFDISDEVNQVIDVAQDVIGNFPGTGLQLDVSVLTGSQNQISFLASQQSAKVSRLEYLPNNVEVTVDYPANTKRVIIYGRVGSTQYYYQIGSQNINSASSGTALILLPQLDTNTRVVAVAENRNISGLYSFPGKPKVSTWDYSPACNIYGSGCTEIY